MGLVMRLLEIEEGCSCALRSPTKMVGMALVLVVELFGWDVVGGVVVRSWDNAFHACFLSSVGLSLWHVC